MGSQIHRERVLGNFKPSKGVRVKEKRTKKSAAERREGMSASHCAYVRKLPCCGCLRIPAGEIHHLKHLTGERGAGMRSTDRRGVPLCRHHHDEVERAGSRNEWGIFKQWGIADPLALADALWNASGDEPLGTKIIIAHRGTK